MSDFRITSFEINRLYGDSTLSIPIVDNNLLIVGLNGAGKTTLLNIFYYFISRQWSRLAGYDFASACAVVNDRKLRVSREEIEAARDLFPIPPDVADVRRPELMTIVDRLASDSRFAQRMRSAYVDLAQMRNVLRQNDMPPVTIEDARILRNMLAHGSELSMFSENLRDVHEFLGSTIDAQILYLPTYRRIEKELSAVLPGLEAELRRYEDSRRRSRAGRESRFIEFVEFGMDDVVGKLKATLLQQNDAARTELNNLASQYLRDVLRGEGSDYNAEVISSLDEDDVEDILNRVEEKTLSDGDKARLRDVIGTVRSDQQLDTSARYVAHFFEKLVAARQKLRENETPISTFVEVCNAYLDDKDLVYNNVDYRIDVVRKERLVQFSSLSSGEKQIVSLFSHL